MKKEIEIIKDEAATDIEIGSEEESNAKILPINESTYLLSEQNREEVLSFPKIVLKIARQAVPPAASRFLAVAGDFVGTAMLARTDSRLLSPCALITSTQNLTRNATAACLFSTGVVTGRLKGEDNDSDIGIVFQQGLVFSLLLSCPSIILMNVCEPIFLLLGQDRSVARVTQQYFRIYSIAMPASLTLRSLQQTALGLYKPGTVLSVIIVQEVLTVGMNYILICGTFGMPKLGVQGYAIGNTAATWITLAGFAAYLKLNRSFKDYHLFQRHHVKESLFRLKELIRLGLPIGIQSANEYFALTACSIIAGIMGRSQLAASEVGMQYAFLTIIPISNLAQSSGIIISRFIGEMRIRSARRTGRMSLLLTPILPSVVLVLFSIIPDPFISLFVGYDNPLRQQIMPMARHLLMINSLGQIADSIRQISAGNLRGNYGTKFAMFTSLVTVSGITIPLACLLGFTFDLGVEGIFIALDVALTTGGAVLLARWGLKKIQQPQNRSIQNDGLVVDGEDAMQEEDASSGSVLSRCCATFFRRNKNSVCDVEVGILDDRTPQEEGQSRLSRCVIM